jgi:hypothetical protein
MQVSHQELRFRRVWSANQLHALRTALYTIPKFGVDCCSRQHAVLPLDVHLEPAARAKPLDRALGHAFGSAGSRSMIRTSPSPLAPPSGGFATTSPQPRHTRRSFRQSGTGRRDRTDLATCASGANLGTGGRQNPRRRRAPRAACARHNSNPCCHHHAISTGAWPRQKFSRRRR